MARRRGGGKTLRALTETVLPRGEQLDLPIEDEIVAGIEGLLPSLPLPLRISFKSGLILLALCPVLVLGKPLPFSRLGPRDRLRVVEKWLRSRLTPVRELMRLMSGLVALLFYDDPRVMEHIGYFIEDHIRQVNADPPVPARDTVPLADLVALRGRR